MTKTTSHIHKKTPSQEPSQKPDWRAVARAYVIERVPFPSPPKPFLFFHFCTVWDEHTTKTKQKENTKKEKEKNKKNRSSILPPPPLLPPWKDSFSF